MRPSSTSHPMLNTVIKARNVLVSQLAASSTPVDSMKTIQQLLTIQSTSLRLRRRIVLSNLLMKDKTDLTKFSILEQKMHIKNFEDNLEAIRKENALLTKDLDKAESVFQTEDVTRELAASLLGGNVLLNAVSRGQNFGSAEMRKEGDENWEKVAMSLYQNLLFVNKGKSDSVYCIVYINSIYRPVCAEEQSRRFMLKVGNIVLSAESKEQINSWKTMISERKMWYSDKSVRRRMVLTKSKVALISQITLAARLSMSILSTCSSPRLEQEEPVIGVSLHDLCQREHSQSPLVYRLLIQHLTDNCVDIEGILRLSGGSDDIAQLEKAITKRSFSLQELKDFDPHAITSTLKGLFRRLPVLLIPKSVNDRIEQLLRQSTPNFKLVLSVYQVIAFLKEKYPEHFEVFRMLCRLFAEIVNRSPTNKMVLQNVLTCFVESVQCCPAIFSCALQNQGLFFDIWK